MQKADLHGDKFQQTSCHFRGWKTLNLPTTGKIAKQQKMVTSPKT